MDSIRKGLGSRIRDTRKKLGMTQKAFGELLGVGISSVSAYEAGESVIPPESIVKIAEMGNVSIDWLLTGKSASGIRSSQMSSLEFFREKAAGTTQELIPEGYAKAGVFHMAGAGLPNLAAEQEPIETIYLPQNLLKPAIVPIKVSGRSMEPMIVNGAIVGVDREDVKIVSGEIYAVWLPYEGAVVKRLYMTTNGVILRSDNPAFPELSIPVSEIGEDHLILGRVKWVLQEF